jgi:hypothetical protein
MCVFATDPVATAVSSLVIDHMHAMSTDVIAGQASDLIDKELSKRNIVAGTINKDMYSTAQIKRHISEHMLHPNVTLAVQLRHLLELSEKMRSQIYCNDEETNETVLDTQQLKNYLALTNQISSVYKLGENNKLLFSRVSQDKTDKI